MASFNTITIVGYLGRDPELRYSPQGMAITTFSVATTEKKKDQNGESKDITTWFQVTAFGRQAENAAQYLFKGHQAYICGRLWLEEWTDREGNKRTTAKVAATDIKFLTQVKESEEGESAPAKPQAKAVAAEEKPPYEDDDSIPF